MRPAMVMRKVIVGAFAGFGLFACAIAAARSTNDLDAQILLQNIHKAAQTLNYTGTFVFQQANQIRTSRITHLFDGKTESEKFEILDGKPREYIRRGDEIVSYLPEIKLLLVEKRITQDVFPAIVPAGSGSLSTHYWIRKGEIGRVAGFDSQVLVLEPKDNLRYGYKLWAEKSTSLLLRAQTINERNEVVEQIAFTQLVIGNIEPAKAQTSYADTQAWRTEHVAMNSVAVTGWTVKSIPPGFKKIREMKRTISDAGPASGNGMVGGAVVASQRDVMQIVYSDGLAAISIFIEPVLKGQSQGVFRQGALNMLGKRQGEFWLTIVGEVPAAAINQVASSIEYISR